MDLLGKANPTPWNSKKHASVRHFQKTGLLEGFAESYWVV